MSFEIGWNQLYLQGYIVIIYSTWDIHLCTEEAQNDLCRSRRKVLKFGWAINNTRSFNGTGSAFILAKI